MTDIREITKADYPSLRDFLYHAVFVPPGSAPLAKDAVLRPEIFVYAENYGKPSDCGVVANEDGKILGMAWTRIIRAYGHVDDSTPELAMSVLPEHRRKGIGTRMMAKLFELLAARGFSQTSLSVNKLNPAVQLYLRLGYTIVRVNEEDYIMVKKLAL
jgi:ribosomal protein S18 acetylase RimI-like enzyme